MGEGGASIEAARGDLFSAYSADLFFQSLKTFTSSSSLSTTTRVNRSSREAGKQKMPQMNDCSEKLMWKSHIEKDFPASNAFLQAYFLVPWVKKCICKKVSYI